MAMVVSRGNLSLLAGEDVEHAACPSPCAADENGDAGMLRRQPLLPVLALQRVGRRARRSAGTVAAGDMMSRQGLAPGPRLEPALSRFAPVPSSRATCA